MTMRLWIWTVALALPLVAFGPSGVAQENPADELAATLRTMSVHSMLELDVLTADDESLGPVYDLVADPTDGLMKFLVVERDEGGLFGLGGGVRVAIPWHRVSVTEAPRRFVLDMALEEVELLPTWEGERTEEGVVGAAPMDHRPDQSAPSTGD